jgi:hypothetical protein
MLVYETAQRLRLPIVFHQGTSPTTAPIRYAHPLVMDEVAMAFPETGDCHGPPSAIRGTPDTIAVVRKHPHVYTDVSAISIGRGSCTTGCGWRPSERAAQAGLWQRLPLSPRPRKPSMARRRQRDRGTGLPPVDVDALHRRLERTLALLGISA